MTHTEALKLALEALNEWGKGFPDLVGDLDKQAISAIKEALAQPQQEPYGWLYLLIVENQIVNEKFDSVNWDAKYEPFGRHGVDHGGKVTKTPLYTFPPQRKPLTDEQIQDVATKAVREHKLSWLGFKKDNQGVYNIPVLSPADYKFARAIEAAHGIKE